MSNPTDAYEPVSLTVSDPPRGGGTQPNQSFIGQTMNASFAWGVQPSTAVIDYVGNAAGVQAGAWIEFTAAGKFFAGLCRSDTVNVGSREGVKRRLVFVDLREFLTYDWTACAFNLLTTTMVNGVRIKRYRHMFPADYAKWTWTWTDGPIMAYEMLNAILGYRTRGLFGGVTGGTVGSPWTWDFTGEGLFPYWGVFNYPLYEFDALSGGGKRLDTVLSEFCQRMGVVMTLKSSLGDPWRLVFSRKGYGAAAAIPEIADNKRVGVAVSGNPTNVKVSGQRNLYQVMDVPLKKDWAAGWEEFLVFEDFVNDIYHRAKDPKTNKTYDKTQDDPEGYVGRQLAMARALEITVGEYAAMRELEGEGKGDPYVDGRKFAGRFRMDMPVALYLRVIVFRAFRPDEELFTFVNAALGPGAVYVPGSPVPLISLDIVDRQLCRIFQTDPTTGTLEYDKTTAADGNGFAIVKGYMVGRDLFEGIKSDQFTLDFFKNASNLWQHVPFQIDDSGEEVRFIIFDEPVIVSDDLVIEKDGHKVLNANATLKVPQARAALVFAAEPFSYWVGTYPDVGRDHVEPVPTLNLEAVVPTGGGSYDEVLYADGRRAIDKALEVGTTVLLRQYFYAEGGYRLPFRPGITSNEWSVQLGSQVDRVQVAISPQEGNYQVVDLANERAKDYFEPERDFERRTVNNSLFSGQTELRTQAENARKLATALRQSPELRRDLGDLIAGRIGSNETLDVVWFPRADAGSMPAGTVMRGRPTTFSLVGGKMVGANTMPTAPEDIDSSLDKVFWGVTVRDGEDTSKPFRVQRTGMGLARVKGPVSATDMLGLNDGDSDDWEYLVKNGKVGVGMALQDVPDGATKLVKVLFGAGGGGSSSTDEQLFSFVRMPGSGDGVVGDAVMEFFIGRQVVGAGTDGGPALGPETKIALPFKLRSAREGAVVEGVSLAYGSYDPDTQTRVCTFPDGGDGVTTEIQVIIPRYLPGDIINCRQGKPRASLHSGISSPPGVEHYPSITWYDANDDGRAWAKKYRPPT